MDFGHNLSSVAVDKKGREDEEEKSRKKNDSKCSLVIAVRVVAIKMEIISFKLEFVS